MARVVFERGQDVQRKPTRPAHIRRRDPTSVLLLAGQPDDAGAHRSAVAGRCRARLGDRGWQRNPREHGSGDARHPERGRRRWSRCLGHVVRCDGAVSPRPNKL